MELRGFEPRIQPCHGRVIPFHYSPEGIGEISDWASAVKQVWQCSRPDVSRFRLVRMVIAGIDEAGYGPVLGPLVSASCAFRVPGQAGLPCVWNLLRRAVSKTKCARGKRLHVNDSKQIYSPAKGLGELERGVLCLLEQATSPAGTLSDVLRLVDAELAEFLPQYGWYDPMLDEKFPLAIEPAAYRISANFFKRESELVGSACVHYRAHVLLERQFNAICEKTRNKASTLFSLVARHIDVLLTQFSNEYLHIVCDRQGGRSHYGSLLMLMFDEWSLEILSESDACSEYRLTNGQRSALITFCEKGESISLPTAAASMLAKYTREALMTRFNAYWRQHVPGVTATAGYYNDGSRFLRDIEAARTALRVADIDLVRQR